MTDRALTVLLHLPIFRGAPSGVLDPLARQAKFQQLERSQPLFHAGDSIEYVHVVVSGSVRVFRMSKDGHRELTLHVEGPRQMVAAIATFQRQAAYPASAEALQTPTEILRLPAEVVQATVFASPDLSAAVIGAFARRQAELLNRIDQLVFNGLSARLALYLLEHAQTSFQLPTNSELAALLGTVPELISRKLGEFYRLGLIQLDHRRVVVANREELRQLLS
ncbi:Crp/Fnr family transcriptional regulator [Deinococcus aquatilis]|uniref:Crp/Fnr family transcriptional regulator n=1 Tax=Deinococcus aquatilis TaxID=519440 RepID=UPI00036D3E05|nr:Crp/Fnr family transcriptional regulator [Deinococcus aquatilis]